MRRFSRFFGLEDPTPKAVDLVRRMVLFMPAAISAYMISTTFWMIQIAESLGGGDYMAGLGMVGVLVVVQLLVQILLDYPSGALGDRIGQRYVVMLALLTHSAAFWFTSMVEPTSPYEYFIAIYVLRGIGQSQESGAWTAWMDNNYRAAMPHDRDRKMYGVMSGRLGLIREVVATVVLLPGSWLAVTYSRAWVFRLQALLCAILALAAVRVLRDFPEVETIRSRQTARGYTGVLRDGIRFLGSSRFVLLVITGEVIIWSVGVVWWDLLLFPLYYTYLTTDVAVAAYRTLIFVPNIVSVERSGVWSRRLEPTKWVPRLRVLQFGGFLFYVLLSAITLLFPGPSDSGDLFRIYAPFTDIPLIEAPVQSLVPIFLIFVTFTIGDFAGSFAGILSQRIMLDVIPNRIRNSLYSLQPTLAMILAAVLIPIFSYLLPSSGFGPTFALAGLITLIGSTLVWAGFCQPIPASEDIDAFGQEPS
ncbi:MAG: MFS transporter [Candidatus Thorarchaeota archaeon]